MQVGRRYKTDGGFRQGFRYRTVRESSGTPEELKHYSVLGRLLNMLALGVFEFEWVPAKRIDSCRLATAQQLWIL